MRNVKRRGFIKMSAGITGSLALGNLLSFCTDKKNAESIQTVRKEYLETIITSARDTYYNAIDSICLERARLLTEAYQLYDKQAPPLLRAKAFDHILQNMTLDLDTNPIFAGNNSSGPRKWMLLPESQFMVPEQAKIEDSNLDSFLTDHKIPSEIWDYWEPRSNNFPRGHLCVQNDVLLTKGLDWIIQEAEKTTTNPKEDTYREAIAISCKAVIKWANRYADEAKFKLQNENDPVKKILYENIAVSCLQVPARPARNMHEALQSILLVHYAMHIEGHGYSVSPGRLDQLLYPYFNEEDNTTELFAAFLVKAYANDLWGSHSKTQAITLGGCNEKQECQCNELTHLWLDAMEMARVNDPHVFLRWHSNTSEKIKQKAIRILMNGHSMPMIVGDAETTKGLISKGVSKEDAWNYVINGCNEIGIPGKLIFVSAGMPEIQSFREVVMDDKSDHYDSVDQFIEATAAICKEKVQKNLENLTASLNERAEVYPTPLTSALMSGCLEKGKDLYEVIHYPFYNLLSIGYTNTINGMAAVNHLVLKEKITSITELRAALENNFKGYEKLHHQIKTTPKWGNEEGEVSNIASKWLSARHNMSIELQNKPEHPVLMEELVTRSLHHMFGSKIKATPDGRMDYEALADSVGAQQGHYLNGPTALLNSVAEMKPAVNWPGGYNLNVTLPLMTNHNENTLNNIKIMTDVFLETGGQEIQINALSEEMLLDAIENPEKYPYLIVRIAGFNGYFTKLSDTEQGEMINRAKTFRI